MAASSKNKNRSTINFYILFLIFCATQSLAQQLIEKYDKIEFYTDDNPHQVEKTIELKSVSFYTNFDKNLSRTGILCLAQDLDEFDRECLSKYDNGTKWIVVNQFDQNSSNELIGNFSDNTKYNTSVEGLIFISDSEIRSDHKYSNPQIITYSKEDEDYKDMKNYAINNIKQGNSSVTQNQTMNNQTNSTNTTEQNQTMDRNLTLQDIKEQFNQTMESNKSTQQVDQQQPIQSDSKSESHLYVIREPDHIIEPFFIDQAIGLNNQIENSTQQGAILTKTLKDDSKIYNATMTHTFTSKCYLLTDLFPLFYICCGILFGVSSVWIAYVFLIRKRQSMQLQKLLTSIPLLLVTYDFLFGKYYQSCPWVNMTISAYAYLRMGKVVTVTFTFTFLHSLIYLLCRGWKTTITTVERNQATNITMVGSMFYLLYSAYFLSNDYTQIYKFINIVLATVYVIFGLTNHIAISQQIKLVRVCLFQNDNIVPDSFKPALRMKYKMLIQMRIFTDIFYFVRFLLYFYSGMEENEETLGGAKASAAVSIVECVNFTFLLWIFRPRKVWPDYFDWRVGPNQFGQVRNRNNQANGRGTGAPDPASLIKIQTAKITNKIIIGDAWDRSLMQKDSNKGSFSSDGSIESFGSMDSNEPVIIVNPNCFTHNDEEANGEITKEQDEGNLMDFISQQEANLEIQRQIGLANRDKNQVARIKAQKANGTYKSVKNQIKAEENNKLGKNKRRRKSSGGFFSFRVGSKNIKKKESVSATDVFQGCAPSLGQQIYENTNDQQSSNTGLYPQFEEFNGAGNLSNRLPLIQTQSIETASSVASGHHAMARYDSNRDVHETMSSFYSNAFGDRQAGYLNDRVVGIGNTVTTHSQNQQHHYFNADYISDIDEEK